MGVFDKIKVWHSPHTDKIYVGEVSKGGTTKQKRDITNEFLGIVIQRWENQTENIESGSSKWEITVKKIK